MSDTAVKPAVVPASELKAAKSYIAVLEADAKALWQAHEVLIVAVVAFISGAAISAFV